MHDLSPSPLSGHYHAWYWQGSAELLDLALAQVPVPPPGAGQVLVRNAVIGLNPVDWKVLGGGLVDWRPGTRTRTWGLPYASFAWRAGRRYAGRRQHLPAPVE